MKKHIEIIDGQEVTVKVYAPRIPKRGRSVNVKGVSIRTLNRWRKEAQINKKANKASN